MQNIAWQHFYSLRHTYTFIGSFAGPVSAKFGSRALYLEKWKFKFFFNNIESLLFCSSASSHRALKRSELIRSGLDF